MLLSHKDSQTTSIMTIFHIFSVQQRILQGDQAIKHCRLRFNKLGLCWAGLEKLGIRGIQDTRQFAFS